MPNPAGYHRRLAVDVTVSRLPSLTITRADNIKVFLGSAAETHGGPLWSLNSSPLRGTRTDIRMGEKRFHLTGRNVSLFTRGT